MGGGENDYLFGGAGFDQLLGGDGTDLLVGDGGGGDRLDGGSGNDQLYGYDGNDVLIGGSGNDAMNGGTGTDLFIFGPGFGKDQVFGFAAGANSEDRDRSPQKRAPDGAQPPRRASWRCKRLNWSGCLTCQRDGAALPLLQLRSYP